MRTGSAIGWMLLPAVSVALVMGTGLVSAEDEAAPRKVTLDGLIQDTLLKSPAIQAKKHAYEAARARVLSAWLPDDPEFSVDVEGQPNLFRFGQRIDNEYMLSQRIPFPTTLILRGQVALRDARIAYQRYKEAERETVWHLEQPYYELYLTKKTLAALEEVRMLIEKLSSAAQARYEVNEGSQQDLLKANIELSKVNIEMFTTKQQEHLAEAHVSHLFDWPLHTRYALPEEPPVMPLSWSQDEMERLAVKARPELQAASLGIRRAKTSRLLAATSWLPDITGRIETRQFKDGRDAEHDTLIGVTVPVWSLLKGAGGGWKAADQDVKEAEVLYTEMKNEVLLSVHEAYAKAKSAEHALTVYEQFILPQAKQQVEVALAAYEAGRSDFLNLIDAQRMLKDAQMAYYRFRADHEIGLANLRLAVGRELVISEQ